MPLLAPATIGSAGHDITSIEDIVFKPGDLKKIHTGIKTEFPSNLVALIRDRSGLGSRGLHILAGVIDSDYRGEWIIIAINLGYNDVVIKVGDKVAQAVFVEHHKYMDPIDVIRGDKGFGSTGR